MIGVLEECFYDDLSRFIDWEEFFSSQSRLKLWYVYKDAANSEYHVSFVEDKSLRRLEFTIQRQDNSFIKSGFAEYQQFYNYCVNYARSDKNIIRLFKNFKFRGNCCNRFALSNYFEEFVGWHFSEKCVPYDSIIGYDYVISLLNHTSVFYEQTEIAKHMPRMDFVVQQHEETEDIPIVVKYTKLFGTADSSFSVAQEDDMFYFLISNGKTSPKSDANFSNILFTYMKNSIECELRTV